MADPIVAVIKTPADGSPVKPPAARPGEFSAFGDRSALVLFPAGLAGAEGDEALIRPTRNSH